LRRARPAAGRRRSRAAVRAPGVDRRSDGPLAAARPTRCPAARDAASPRPEGSGRLQPLCLRRDARRALRRGGWVSAGAAQAAGAVGALGLALLIAAPRRDLRIAGLIA